jgi:hypothetical protein
VANRLTVAVEDGLVFGIVGTGAMINDLHKEKPPKDAVYMSRGSIKHFKIIYFSK